MWHKRRSPYRDDNLMLTPTLIYPADSRQIDLAKDTNIYPSGIPLLALAIT